MSALSLFSRALWLDNPGTLIFDENFYVNAARVIAGVEVPRDAPYSDAVPELDPQVDQPPLAKVIIAGSIKVFGDRPIGWRAPSLAFGSLAIVALYWLVRSAGGSPWLGVGTASIMAADNLFLVHGRIATLDIFVVAFMLGAVALYLRGRPGWAGAALGVGACTKLVGWFALPVVVALEVLRLVLPPEGSPRPTLGPGLRRLGACTGAAVVCYLSVLWALDARFTTFSNPVAHTRYMVSYADEIPDPVTAPGVRTAPTSKPWQWLANRGSIPYYRHGYYRNRIPRTTVFFQGRMSPPIILLAIPALVFAALVARRDRDGVSFLAVAWFLGSFLTLTAVALRHDYNYLYYMLLVLPGAYVALARLFSGRLLPPAVTAVYSGALVWSLVALFPFRSWAGH